MGNRILCVAVAALVLTAVPAAAFADDGRYAPVTPRDRGLAGSTATVECEGGVPRIVYDVRAVGVDEPITSAEIVLTGDAGEVTLALAEREPAPAAASTSGTPAGVAGSVLWPGTTLDAAGAVVTLPGWIRVDGGWEPRDDGLAWTRGDVRAELRAVGLRLGIPLAYPEESAGCAAPAGTASPLATTGVTLPPAVIAAGAGAIVVGALLTWVARRRRADAAQ